MGTIIAYVKMFLKTSTGYRARVVDYGGGIKIYLNKMEEKKRGENFKGYIQVYTGNGKGKTSAALGLALRAAGHGYKTFFGQFLKGQDYGELASLQNLSSLITIEQFGRKGFIHVTEDPDIKDIQKAQKGLEKCLKMMKSGKFHIIVLDEINVAVHFNLFTEKDIHDFLDKRPEGIEVILTGRYAPQSFIDRADLVTEMKEIKHYYQKGIKSRLGIEK
jgi:cob(I)alamin adenosyltransferase